MRLDPELVRGKRRSVIFEWMRFAAADALYDDWQAEVANFEMNRALNERPN
jgi:hypothetical protein